MDEFSFNKKKWLQDLKIQTLSLMVIIITVVLTLFSIFRFYKGQILHGYADLVVAMIILSSLFYLRKSQMYYNFFSRAYILLGMIMAFLNITYIPDNKTKGIWWTFVIVLSYFLRDKKEGFLWNIAFILIVVSATVFGVGYTLSTQDLLTLIVNFLLVSSILFWYEKIKEKSEDIDIKNKEKDQIIFQQNKMIAMGELVAFIAHQWRQPLMEISTLLMELEANISIKNKLDKESVLKTIKDSNAVMEFMSSTINDFQNFFSPKSTIDYFEIESVINTAITMVKSVFKFYSIEHEIINELRDDRYYGSSNEFAQVVLNLLINSKDQFVEKNITNPKIVIKLKEDEKHIIIEFEDNGGGVDKSVVNNLFEPFITTKDEKGNGMGLFLSKKIINDKFEGELECQNIVHVGVRFTIKLPKQS